MKRNLYIGGMLLALLAMLGAGSAILEQRVAAQSAKTEAPMFEVDPFWPKPLPNNWRIGSAVGVAVDADDNVWIIHRPESVSGKEAYATTDPPGATCCVPAPPVLGFDQAGNLIGHWGGSGDGYTWPVSNHGITIDHKGNVWIGGNGRGQDAGRYADSQVLKFTRSGRFLMKIGTPGMSKGSNDTANVRGPARVHVDPRANEVFVADGYGNRRVAVFDADTGEYKRHWGAYGNRPDDTDIGRYDPDAPPAQQFRTPVHCAEVSHDGLVYVCDRANDRIQIFRTDGTFVREVFVAPRTLGDGSVWEIAFSRDPEQKYLFVADGANEKVYIMLRETMETLTTFGAGGRQPGQFYAVHSIATDSEGNIYTTETYEGKRVQRFINKGLGPVTTMHQGAPWPKTSSR